MAVATVANQSRNMNMNRNNTPYEFESFTTFDLFNFESYTHRYPKLVEFVKGYFSTKQHLFNPLKSLYDPFIQGTTNADGKKTYTDFYQWYTEKNPTFGSHENLYIPEYEIALVQMCRDLLFVHSRNKYILSNNARRKINNLRKTKKNNIITHANINTLISNNEKNSKSLIPKDIITKTYGKTKINNTSNREILELFNFIESTLPSELKSSNDAYIYKNFIKILYHFLRIMSFHSESKSESKLPKNLIINERSFTNYFLAFPLLLYPTYMQIDFKITLLLSASPIINFRLTNRYRFVHDNNSPPFDEIFHDVLFHGINSHYYDILLNKTISTNDIFSEMNKFIKLLQPHFDYDEKDASLYVELENNKQLVITNEPEQELTNIIIMSNNQCMVCYCLLLFMFIHETRSVELTKYLFIKNQVYQLTIEDIINNIEIAGHPGNILGNLLLIFSEQDENKAVDKFKFLKNIDCANVFINFVRLLFSLKEQILKI